MLTELHIENLGVIESLDVVFNEGLSVLTGETGAGKTMLIEAISLLVGDRAEPSMVRPGASEARVEGRFVVGDDEVVLARVIPVSGRSRAYVNGRLATVATLAEQSLRLVDIHGQHAHQSLLSPATQRDALDQFASIDLGQLRNCRARLTEIDAALAALGGDARTRAREVDLLRYQLEEIDAAGIDDADEERELERRHDLLADAVAHREAAALVLGHLDDDGGALDGVRAALAALGSRTPFTDTAERLRTAHADLTEVASDLRREAEAIEDDPRQLAEVTERRQLLRTMRRKYGDTLADVIEFRDRQRARFDELAGYEQRVAQLELDRVGALRAERKAAAAVGAARRAAADELAKAVQTRLRTLAMPRANLTVAVGADDPGDDVTMLFSANPGLGLLPLTKVASGGELARTMLALRLVLSSAPSTLVFDEVDAGIGGAAATAVGEALALLGHQHQVLVVTHLAQVAALADDHLVVHKVIENDITLARLARVADDARVGEVARMLSGNPDSAVAREHAAALLAEAAPHRSGATGAP
ncbi:MAG: DNA repair protein RecN [Actinomycetota bacterium]